MRLSMVGEHIGILCDKFQGVGIFQCICWTIPVYLITEYNYIVYVVMLLGMPFILLYLSPQVGLKLVHWI